MSVIKTTSLGRYSYSKIFQFFEMFIALVRRIGADKLKVEKLFNEILVPSFEHFDSIYKNRSKVTKSNEITTDTKQRNKIMSSIGRIIDIAKNDVDVELREVALRLEKVYDDFNKFRDKLQKEQVADITNFVQVMNGECKADADKLNLKRFIDELSRLNTKINENYSIRYKEMADEEALDIPKSKNSMIANYKNLIQLIEVYIFSEGMENYEDFVRTLNIIIDDYEGNKKSDTDIGDSYGKPNENNDNDDDNGDIPDNDDSSQEELEAKYPDAKKWEEDLPFMGVENGDIYYILVDEKKVFYKLVDKSSFFDSPDSAKGEIGWEKLN